MDAPKILLIPNGSTTRDRLSSTLTEIGCEVYCASNAVTAATHLSNDTPEIVLLDGSLPEQFVLQLVTWLHDNGFTNVPVVMLERTQGELSVDYVFRVGAHGTLPMDLPKLDWVYHLHRALHSFSTAEYKQADISKTIKTPAIDASMLARMQGA